MSTAADGSRNVSIDPRLIIPSENRRLVRKTPRSNQIAVYDAYNNASPSLTPAIAVPLEPDVVVDPSALLAGELVYKLSFVSGSSTTATGTYTYRFGDDVVAGHRPLHNALDNATLRVGSVSTRWEATDFALFSRLGDDAQRAMETCPASPADVAIVTNPPSIPKNSADGTFKNSCGQWSMPNGAYPLIGFCDAAGAPVTASATFGPAVVAGGSTAQWSFDATNNRMSLDISAAVFPATTDLPPLYVKIVSRENLWLQPFWVHCSEGRGKMDRLPPPAIPHLTNALLNMTFASGGRSSLTLVQNTAARTGVVPRWSVTSSLIGVLNTKMYLQLLGSEESVAVPSMAFLPALAVFRYDSTPALPAFNTSTQITTSLAAPFVQTITASVDALPAIPDFLWIRVRPDPKTPLPAGVRGPISFPIQSLSIQNESGISCAATPQEELHAATVRNGYSVPWAVFTGLAGGRQRSVTVASDNAGPVSTVGSGVLLSYGRDVGLPPTSSAGVPKPVRLVITATFYQTVPFALGVPILHVTSLIRGGLLNSVGLNREDPNDVNPVEVMTARPDYTLTTPVSDSPAGPGVAYRVLQREARAGMEGSANVKLVMGPGASAPGVSGPG